MGFRIDKKKKRQLNIKQKEQTRRKKKKKREYKSPEFIVRIFQKCETGKQTSKNKRRDNTMMDFMAKLNTLLLQSTKKNYKENKNRERKTKKKKRKVVST